MQILHVIPSLSPKRGGPSVAVRRMAEGVARQGVTVHVVATDDDGAGRLAVPHNTSIEENGVTYRYFARQTPFYTVSVPLTQWLFRHVSYYDVVHIHALFSYPVAAAAWAAQRAKVPYIVRPLGTLNQWGIENRRPLLKQGSLTLIEKPLLRRAARVHYTSHQEETEASAAGIDAPSAVIPLGLDLAPFQTLPSPTIFRNYYSHTAQRPLVLFLSRLDPKKGIDLLLPAFAAVRQQHPEALLVMAGDGETSYVAELCAQCDALGISQDVLWTGFLQGEMKLAALAAADVFVLPSYSENFGIAAVEALAAGAPLVVSDRVAIHHEIQAAQAGVVVPCDTTALAKGIAGLLANTAERQRLSIAGRQLAASHFSQEAMTEKLMALYQTVIASRATVTRRAWSS